MRGWFRGVSPLRWFVRVSLLVIAVTLFSDIWFDVDMRVAANVAAVPMAVGATVFAVLYGLRSNWRASGIGRAYLAFKVTMAAVLWQIVIAVWVDTDWPGRQHVRYAIYSVGVVMTVVWVVTLIRVQNRARQDRAS